MFTGIVAGVGRVEGVDCSDDGVRVTVATPLAAELAPGDSVAVNGVCLTATSVLSDAFVADVMNETLTRTSLAGVAPGAELNLELPLRASDRLGGHVVQGHVDAVGAIADVRADGFSRRVRISAPPDVLRYVVEKGSVAVDGVSLTVAAVDGESFEVSLIPETLERTSLGRAQAGTPVNLEVDLIAKYVEKAILGLGLSRGRHTCGEAQEGSPPPAAGPQVTTMEAAG